MAASKWPALFVLLFVGLAAVACGGGDETKSVSDNDISKVAGNFERLKSFKATISGQGTPQVTVEYQQPSSIRSTVGSGAQEQQIICLDSDFYAKLDNTGWQKVPQGGGSRPSCRANLGPSDPKVLGDGIKAATTDPALVKGGEEKVNGKQCQIYTRALPDGGSLELCIAGGLPQRVVSRGTGGQAVTITFSDFDKPIEIKAPI